MNLIIRRSSGTALPSLTAALLHSENKTYQSLPAPELVTITDYPSTHLLDALQTSINYNISVSHPSHTKTKLVGHAWGDLPPFRSSVSAAGDEDDNINHEGRENEDEYIEKPNEEHEKVEQAKQMQRRWTMESQSSYDMILACDTLWLRGKHIALAESIAYFLKSRPATDQDHRIQSPNMNSISGRDTSVASYNNDHDDDDDDDDDDTSNNKANQDCSKAYITAGYHTGVSPVRDFLCQVVPQNGLSVIDCWEMDTEFVGRECIWWVREQERGKEREREQRKRRQNLRRKQQQQQSEKEYEGQGRETAFSNQTSTGREGSLHNNTEDETDNERTHHDSIKYGPENEDQGDHNYNDENLDDNNSSHDEDPNPEDEYKPGGDRERWICCVILRLK